MNDKSPTAEAPTEQEIEAAIVKDPKSVLVVLFEADAEVQRLRRLIAWCRARLSKDAYRETLDRMLATRSEPDHTPIVRSAETHG